MKTDNYIRSITISLAASATFGIATTAMADTIVVDCMGSGDYETLQEAVDDATSGDTISVLPCTYFVDGVDKDVDIDSKELHIVSTDGPVTTIIEVDKDWSIKVSGADPDVTLEGFTIRQSDAGAQAAVRLLAGELTVDGCVFRDNGRWAHKGGAIFASNFDDLTVEDSVFENNHADYGGAIYAEDGNLGARVEITHTDFISNDAYLSGGAVHLRDTSMLIVNGYFKDNSSSTIGGGLYYRSNDIDHTATLLGARFSKNASLDEAGAVYISNAAPTVNFIDSHFDKNDGTNYAGAVGIASSSCHFEGCSFTKNYAEYGGGLDVYFGTANFESCTFKKNTATIGGGGGLEVYKSDVTFTDGKFTKNNSDDWRGGGVRCQSSTAEFNGVVFLKNSANEGGGLYAGSSNVTLKESLLKKNSAIDKALEPGQSIGGAIVMDSSTINFKDLEILQNKTEGTIGGMSLTDCDGKIIKCTIEDNEHEGLTLVDSPIVEIKKTNSCHNDAKDIKGDYVDEGDNTFCNE